MPMAASKAMHQWESWEIGPFECSLKQINLELDLLLARKICIGLRASGDVQEGAWKPQEQVQRGLLWPFAGNLIWYAVLYILSVVGSHPTLVPEMLDMQCWPQPQYCGGCQWQHAGTP